LPDANTHWSDLTERGVVWGLRFLTWVYKLLGRRMTILCTLPIILFFYLTGTTQRRGALQFLAHVDAVKNSQPPGFFKQHWRGLKIFVNFSLAALDKISAWAGATSPDQITFPDGVTSMFELGHQKQGCVLLVSHLGNIEAIRAIASLHRQRKFTILAHTRHAQQFNRILEHFDSRSQIRLIEVTDVGPDVAILLRNRIHEGEWVVIAADRVPVLARERTVKVDFLGKPAPFSIGPYVLAHLLEAPVMMAAALRVDNKFQIFWRPLTERLVLPRKDRDLALKHWAGQYSIWLEELCLQYPLQWYNFFDFWHQDTSPHSEETL
jgi:predicted LPLAT superfamily acyltransferase